MTNGLSQFLTTQLSSNAPSAANALSKNGSATANASNINSGAGNAPSPISSDFFAFIIEQIEQGQAGESGLGSNPFATKSSGEAIAEFSTLGLGNLTQEQIAQLTAQIQSGQNGGALTLSDGLLAGLLPEGEIAINDLFGLNTSQNNESLNGLLGQVNQILQNGDLQSSNPDLYSKLSAFQKSLTNALESGEIITPQSDLSDLASELNAILTAGFETRDPASINRLGALQQSVQSFLTAPPAATQDFQTQLRPDILGFLNGQNFAGLNSRGKFFGAIQGQADLNINGNLAAQLNAIEPGSASSKPTQSFLELLQQFTSNPGRFGGDPLGSIFSQAGDELAFTGNQQQAVETQQNQLLANSNPLGMNAASSSAVQAAQAGSSHPASQLVAAHIAKNAAANKPHQMTLHLNPPELGRVHVVLELTRDQSLKAKITTEKPDTYSLLQRDADSLQKALEEAGIELGNDGLEFELADGEGDFNDFLKEQGYQTAQGEGSREDDEEILQSQMDIHVDPETGMIHYNILA